MYDKTIVERKSYAASKLTAPNHIWGIDITSPQYIDRLRDANAQISMDARRRSVDNIFTERLWRTFKYEEAYLVDYASPREARQRLDAYFDFHNFQRPHQHWIIAHPLSATNFL